MNSERQRNFLKNIAGKQPVFLKPAGNERRKRIMPDTEEKGIAVRGLMSEGLSVRSTETTAISAASRARGEIEAAVYLSANKPREEYAAVLSLEKSCRRPGFAERAMYRFPRGGSEIKGMSVVFAREAARCWGNIRHGIRITQSDEIYTQVTGFAWDVESNTYVENESKFKNLVQRKVATNRRGANGRPEYETQWVKPDERDYRELVNKHGAICVRNAILQLIPADIVDSMFDLVEDTVRSDTKSGGKTKEEQIKYLVSRFDEFGVTIAMLESYLGHKLAECSTEEIVELKQIGISIRDGNSTREEYFSFSQPGGAKEEIFGGESKAAALAGELKKKRGRPAGTPNAPKEPSEPTLDLEDNRDAYERAKARFDKAYGQLSDKGRLGFSEYNPMDHSASEINEVTAQIHLLVDRENEEAEKRGRG
jgi:hypothetical protein